MFGIQSIRNPYGVVVFGSALLRVDPDLASLDLGVSKIEPTPKKAFASAREAGASVRKSLKESGVTDFGASRINLSQEYDYTGSGRQFLGYQARVDFRVVTDRLDEIESILINVVNAGVNDVSSVTFQCRRLKELRAQARSRAVAAAREKALIYCEAADVTLGTVLHIEDVSPDVLRGRADGHSHAPAEFEADDEVEFGTYDPGTITIAGAVRVAYALGQPTDS